MSEKDAIYTSRTWASLNLWGTDLDPEQVTSVLGVTPTRSHNTGGSRGRHPRTAEELTWPHALWSLSSKSHVSSTTLEAHIAWLIEQVLPAKDMFLAYARREDVQADVFAFWESATGHGGPRFSPKLLGDLASLDLELNLDIYF